MKMGQAIAPTNKSKIMKLIIANAFSLNMMDTIYTEGITISKLLAEDVKNILQDSNFESVVGHAGTAQVFSNILGMDIQTNRTTFKIDPTLNTGILVGQYSGPRLDEGATELPDGAKIQWFSVIFPIANH